MKRLSERLRSLTGPVSSRLPHRLSGQALQPLIVLCLGAGALAGFIGIADNVLEGETHRIDRAILLALRTAEDAAEPIGPAWMQEVFADITALGGYPILTLVSLIAAAYLAILRQWGSIVLLLISLLGGTGLSALLKDLFDRPRPDLVAHLVEVQSMGFPSGHATASAVAYLTLGALLTRTQPRRRLKLYVMAVAIALAVLVGISRVYLGVHYPNDVLAGWCLGSAWAMGCWFVARVITIRASGRSE